IVRSPRTFVERPPASSTMIPRGARSQGFEVQSSAASIAPSATSMCCQNPPNERLLRAASRRARIFAWSCAFLLGPVPVVNTIALLSVVTFETWSRLPSRYAPSPRYAHQRECRPGALTIAATISPFDSIPISVPNVGIPRENSSVPSIGSMLIRAEIPQRNRIRLLRDRIQKRSIFLAVAHSFSLVAVLHSNGCFQSPVPIHQSPHLTPSSRTPSIQSYRNVCSRQHWNRSGPHLGSAARRSRAPQTRASGDGPQVWSEGGHAAARFFRRVKPRRFERYRGTKAGFAFARGNSRSFRTSRTGAVLGSGRSLCALCAHGSRVFSRVAEESSRGPQVRSAPRSAQGFYFRS